MNFRKFRNEVSRTRRERFKNFRSLKNPMGMPEIFCEKLRKLWGRSGNFTRVEKFVKAQ